MTDKPTNPEGQPITLKYLMDAYARARASGEFIIIEEAAVVPPSAWNLSPPLHAKMRRDATISVIKVKCGVK